MVIKLQKESKRVLKRVLLVNRFDRACNYTLLHIFPFVNRDEKAVYFHEALDYAEENLSFEKKALKEIRSLISKKAIDAKTAVILLNEIEFNQSRRHSEMSEIIEGKRVR